METKLTIPHIVQMKKEGRKISMLTAYDASMAALIDETGVDILLVGDSLGMVVLGLDSTVPVTMDEMIHHAKAVGRGTKHALIIGDMPYGSYQCGIDETVANGIRFRKEAGCDAVKVEGGEEICEAVKALVRAGVPVMGHLGLTPQTAGQLGGFKVQGRDLEAAKRMVSDAGALEQAGAFGLVLECLPSQLGQIITEKISIPTIGIGAGPHCDGQVLVTNDLIGLFEKFTPKFVKTYIHLAPQIKTAVSRFREDVETGTFPDDNHSFATSTDLSKLLEE